MSWAFKKRLQILSVLLVFLAIVGGFLYVFFFYRTPSCTDGKQNGNEVGLDCGGSCPYLCASQTEALVILWQRSFRVSSGVWSSLAYVENPNKNAISMNVPYHFGVYDSNNILVYEKDGQISIPAGKSFAVFEPKILTGERIPARTIFEFTKDPKWAVKTKNEPNLVISSQKLSNLSLAPRLDIVVGNEDSKLATNIQLVAIIYDGDGNVIGSSNTIVDSIMNGDSVSATFTWPEPFSQPAVRSEVLYKVF